jgi:ABC-type Mn2+/Zn2+ transport system permease subunit
MLARSWSHRLLVGWVVAASASLIGLGASYLLDLPTGAAVVVACGLLLAIVSLIAIVRRA